VAFTVVTKHLASEHGSLQREGFTLHYTTEGTGKPIVFLSGGPGYNVDYFAAAAKYFPPGYKFIFLEQRGTGRSHPDHTNAETMTVKLLVEDLEALRSHLKVERFILAGHSWGGMLAMAYAAAYPDGIDSMILIGPGGPTLEFRDWKDDNIATRVRPGEDDVNAYFFDRNKVPVFLAVIGDKDHDTNKLLNDDLKKHYDVRDGIKRLRRPVLIVHGHQDPIGDKTAEDIHHLISSSKLRYIHKCGHFPWIEQPEQFQKILADFLST
jgi:proline iminopeptidase